MITLPAEYVRKTMREAYYAVKDLSDDDLLYGPVENYFLPLQMIKSLSLVSSDFSGIDSDVPTEKITTTIACIENLLWMFGLRYEIEAAKTISNNSSPWEALQNFVYYDAYIETTRMEFEGAGLQAGQKIVHIGSGPLPISLILFYKMYGVESIGIEIDPRCYESSKELIGNLGLGENISILLGDHHLLPVNTEVQHYIVGLDARPKAEIFAHLAAFLPRGASVSYRFNKQAIQNDCLATMMDMSYLSYQKFPDFREIAVSYPRPPAINIIAFLLKEAGV
jgi:hypothetical protein